MGLLIVIRFTSFVRQIVLLKNFHVVYLVHLIEQPILRIPNFNCLNLRCCKVFLSFWYKELHWHFLVYCDINLNLLPCNNTQKVNKQKKSLQIFGIRIGCSNELKELIIYFFLSHSRFFVCDEFLKKDDEVCILSPSCILIAVIESCHIFVWLKKYWVKSY